MSTKQRVLLTGATGFVGTHAHESLLNHGFEVHGVTSQTPPDVSSNDAMVWHQCDLLDHDAASKLVRKVGATHLLHLAWYVQPGKLITADENFDWVAASLNLVRSFREHGGQRVVCSGSCYEYDWNYGYCSEKTTPTTPDTVYGACKNALRELLEIYCRQHGIGFGWGRVFFLYGPHENPNRLVSSVTRSMLEGREAKSSHGRQIRDYAHVGDVAQGLVALLQSDYDGALNIATGQAMQIRDIVTHIADITDRASLLKLGALPARANDLPLVVADTTLANETLDWRPKFELRSGLEDTVQWWQLQTAANEGNS
ncbi:MAG: NAD(P)-dependent oxidoreductase [Polyangiales bacterium]